MFDTCASCVMGWLRFFTYWMLAWISPIVMMPWIASADPAMATAT